MVGYGYRPVQNYRLNALVKYTYFYNVPTTDQLGLQNTGAEFLQKSHSASGSLGFAQDFACGLRRPQSGSSSSFVVPGEALTNNDAGNTFWK